MVLFRFHCMAKLVLVPGPVFISMALWVGGVKKNSVADNGGVETA